MFKSSRGKILVEGAALERLRALLTLENEVMYVIEALSQDFTGEAKSGMTDVLDCLDKTDYGAEIDGHIRGLLAEAREEIIVGHDVPSCSRKVQTIRRRLANEIALMMGDTHPYTVNYYPTYTPCQLRLDVRSGP